MDDYGPDIITLSDEAGVEYELEILARFEYEGAEYIAVTPAGVAEADEMEVSILKRADDDFWDGIEDDTELENVYAVLEDLMFEEDEPPADE